MATTKSLSTRPPIPKSNFLFLVKWQWKNVVPNLALPRKDGIWPSGMFTYLLPTIVFIHNTILAHSRQRWIRCKGHTQTLQTVWCYTQSRCSIFKSSSSTEQSCTSQQRQGHKIKQCTHSILTYALRNIIYLFLSFHFWLRNVYMLVPRIPISYTRYNWGKNLW